MDIKSVPAPDWYFRQPSKFLIGNYLPLPTQLINDLPSFLEYGEKGLSAFYLVIYLITREAGYKPKDGKTSDGDSQKLRLASDAGRFRGRLDSVG